jgi:hypothetical protein
MNMVGWLVARFLYSLFFMGRTTFVCVVCVRLALRSPGLLLIIFLVVVTMSFLFVTFDSQLDVTGSQGHKDDWTDAVFVVAIILHVVWCPVFSPDHRYAYFRTNNSFILLNSRLPHVLLHVHFNFSCCS